MKLGTILIIFGVALAVAGIAINATSNKEHASRQGKPTTSASVRNAQEKPVLDKKPVVKPSEPSNSDTNHVTKPPVTADKAVEAVMPEQTNKEKGNDFEGYVADVMKANAIRLQQWNQGTTSAGGAFAENAKNPDFFVDQKYNDSRIEYWVECKYRSSLHDGKFRLEEYQYNRYKEIQKESKRRIMLAVGVGGNPAKPDNVYLIPLSELPKYGLEASGVESFRLANPGRDFATTVEKYFRENVFRKYKNH